MALRQLAKNVNRASPTLRLQASASFKTDSRVVMEENSSQYSSDGEKIYCGYTVTKGVRHETETVVESARAKAFDDSLNGVISMKYEDSRDTHAQSTTHV